MFSIINTIVVLIVICVLYLYTVSFIGKYLKYVSNRNLIYNEFISEFNTFVFTIICKNIFERLVRSKRDQNGGIVALTEFTNISHPVFNGLVVSVIGSMSQDMKDKFYTFYKYTDDDYALITEVASMIDNYSILLIKRLNNFEIEIKNTNKIAVQNGDTPVESAEVVFNKLVESVADDIRTVKKYI